MKYLVQPIVQEQNDTKELGERNKYFSRYVFCASCSLGREGSSLSCRWQQHHC